ncbi:pectate lyase [Micromonospora rosaria]|uniref:Pectate lyase n=1 Tax=Micromonospora rosaria TaxID=47874 RepID=A0A136PNJ4_9ACTN|nr:family 16 glycoside hydrolase [Micromonospora rosaria]KXK59995.1 pectate lyase [Micromonospora rosaria]
MSIFGRVLLPRHRPLLAGGLALATVTAVVASAAGTANAATLLTEDFEGGTTAAWSRSGGSWSVTAEDSGVYRQASTGSDARAQSGATSWTDYGVEARVRPLAFSGVDRSVGVVARAQSMSSYYHLGLTNTGRVQLGKRLGGNPQVLATSAATVTTGTWYTLRLEAFGSSLRGFLDGVQVLSATDTSLASGRVGLYTSYASASFDDVVVEDTPASGGPGTPTPSPTTSPPPAGTCDTSGRPTGFASVTAWGQSGTTGGAGGPTVEVDTATEFLAAIGQPGPLNICVRGMIALPSTPQMHDVTSDKTIVGIGANSGITGGGLTIGLPVDATVTSPPPNAVHNVIIRNMVFRGATDDSINIQMFSHHIWVDHSDLSQGYDGLLDIKRGSSYVTVSWNHFHHHTKNMLLGHDDRNGAQDIGRLKVTYHHNWLDGTPQRNPRIRFGEPVHIYNNYFYRNSDAGVACQADAGCLVEGNYFDSVEEPVTNRYAGPAGRCVARNNVFTGTEPGQPVCSGSVQEARDYYGYTLDDPATVKAVVTAGAGVGRI